MAKRYGRNQKRKHLEQINRLQWENYNMNENLISARHSIAAARQDAFKEFAINTGAYKAAIAEIAYKLGERLGEELLPHAQKLLNARKGELLELKLDATHPYAESIYNDYKYSTIDGSIPSLHYRIKVLK